MNPLKLTLALAAATLGIANASFGAADSSPERHSTFEDREVNRNPFLPIGWSKGVPQAVRQVATVTPDAFRVTSIVVGGAGDSLAIVNGKTCGAGDILMVQEGGGKVPVRVKEVRDGEVVLFHEGHPIVAPLIRK